MYFTSKFFKTSLVQPLAFSSRYNLSLLWIYCSRTKLQIKRPRKVYCSTDHTISYFFMSVQSCAVLFVGAEAGMREFNSGFHGADTRPGTVSQPLASLVCVITAPFSSRSCFCGVASKRLMGWKKTLAQRYGSCSPLCFCLFECTALTLFSPLSLHPSSVPSSANTACVVVWGKSLKGILPTSAMKLAV